jgi:hypothetical protein
MRSTMTALLALLAVLGAALGLAAPVAAQTPPPAAASGTGQASIQKLESFQGIAGLMNLARGCVRIVAVVAPSAPGADAQLDTILSVLRTNPSKRLRAYVLVAHAADADAPLQAALFASRHPGERVVFLWDPNGVSNLWKESVGIKDAGFHTLFCLYDTAATFTLAPATPDAWIEGVAGFDPRPFTDRTRELLRRVESKVAGTATKTP